MNKPTSTNRPSGNKVGRPRKKIDESDLICISGDDDKIPLRLRRQLERPDAIRFGYVRVSTKLTKTSNGKTEFVQTFDSQLGPIVNKYGVMPSHVFCDRSSGVKERFSLERLCQIARPGDEIIVFRLDRLGRSAGEMILRVQELNKRGVSLISASDGQIYSSGGQNAKILLSVFAMLADLEREALIERVREGQALAYQRHPERFGRPRKINDDRKRLIIQMRANGESAISTARALNISRSSVYGVWRAADAEQIKNQPK